MEFIPDLCLDVLVVDDIATSRAALSAMVREAGHTVREAAGGDEALHRVREAVPDLVLLDLLMPGVDGFTVSRRIREHVGARWVPVIAMSSLQGDDHVIEALASGADDHLERPVNRALLQAKLAHYRRVLGMQLRLGVMAQRQRDIQDNIADPVLTLDDEGQILEANLSAGRQFADGRPKSLEGQALPSLLGLSMQALLDGKPVTLQLLDGRVYPAEISASAWREQGRSRVTVVIRDLTERQRIDRMRDEFLATVSHELRTPLTSVLGAVGLLASGAAGALPQAALPLAQAAQRNGIRLSKLIDDVLDLTKLEGDRMEMHLRPQRLDPLVQESITANQGYAAAAGVTLRYDRPDPHGAAGVKADVRVDADRFLQVMANLLSNAIKHSPRGQSVTATLQPGPESWRVSVADSGPGVPAEFRAQLFEKFSQADQGDRRTQGGTGLGLYITRMLVQRMGGRIMLDPDNGSGAVFSVEFPVAGRVLGMTAPRLLHIERDADLRQRLSAWLTPQFEIRSQGIGDLDDDRLQGVAVVIANPQGQGPADVFCAELRRRAHGRPVLLYSDSVDAGFAAAQGFDWLAMASANAVKLREVVRELVARPRSQLAAGGRR